MRRVTTHDATRLPATLALPFKKHYHTSGLTSSQFHNAFGSSEIYDWNDPLLFHSQLTEDERMVWESARDFCQGELQPRILEANRHEKTLDHALMEEFGRVGLLGSTIPEEYGGAGLGYVSYGLIATEVERVDSAYRSAMSVQSSLVMFPIYAYANEKLKRKYLPELAAGRMIGCFGLTEVSSRNSSTYIRGCFRAALTVTFCFQPNHGSDPNGMETKSALDKGTNEYVLNGSKNWITNSPIADVFVVWARNEEGKIKGYIVSKGKSTFLPHGIGLLLRV